MHHLPDNWNNTNELTASKPLTYKWPHVDQCAVDLIWHYISLGNNVQSQQFLINIQATLYLMMFFLRDSQVLIWAGGPGVVNIYNILPIKQYTHNANIITL